MALEGVVKDIVETAEREADAIIQKAEEQRRTILDAADEKISKMRKVKEKELEEALRRLRRQEISSAELEAKKLALVKKKEIMEQIFEETLGELSAMPSADKKRIYGKSLESARRILLDPRVFCPVGERDLLSGFGGLSEIAEREMEAGLIMENSDGSIRLDYRFRTLLMVIWEHELKRVSDILFG